jgi:hypothetical protein
MKRGSHIQAIEISITSKLLCFLTSICSSPTTALINRKAKKEPTIGAIKASQNLKLNLSKKGLLSSLIYQ